MPDNLTPETPSKLDRLDVGSILRSKLVFLIRESVFSIGNQTITERDD